MLNFKAMVYIPFQQFVNLSFSFLLNQHIKTFQGFLLVAYLCCRLITFTNSLDPDQARQNVGPNLDANCLTL